MNDNEIVTQYFERNENAIKNTADKYGKYCYSIALGILFNKEDAEECVNDTYVAAWGSIPPNRPERLATYLGKIIRRIALNKWRDNHAKKRYNENVDVVLDELAEVIPDNNNVEAEVERKLLTESINRFLESIPEIEQKVFVCRYWHMDTVADVSKQFGFSESKVKSMLFRCRKKLKKWLESEGILYENI